MYTNPKFIFGANGNYGSLLLYHQELKNEITFPLTAELTKELRELFGVDVGCLYTPGFKAESSVSKQQFSFRVFQNTLDSSFRFYVNTTEDQKKTFTEFVKKVYRLYSISDDVVEI